MALKKSEMMASIPAIQPVKNKELKRVASGYGRRIDPYYKKLKFHYGVDFSAPKGTHLFTPQVMVQLLRSKKVKEDLVIMW